MASSKPEWRNVPDRQNGKFKTRRAQQIARTASSKPAGHNVPDQQNDKFKTRMAQRARSSERQVRRAQRARSPERQVQNPQGTTRVRFADRLLPRPADSTLD
jgi:hypothetical protein